MRNFTVMTFVFILSVSSFGAERKKRKPSQEYNSCEQQMGDRKVSVIGDNRIQNLVIEGLPPAPIHASGMGQECQNLTVFPSKKIIVMEFFKGLAGTKEIVEETSLYVYKIKNITPKEAAQIAKEDEPYQSGALSEVMTNPPPKPTAGEVLELDRVIPTIIKATSKTKIRYVLKLEYNLDEKPDHIRVNIKDVTIGRDGKPKNNTSSFELK
jgi:hypothetical protein